MMAGKYLPRLQELNVEIRSDECKLRHQMALWSVVNIQIRNVNNLPMKLSVFVQLVSFFNKHYKFNVQSHVQATFSFAFGISVLSGKCFSLPDHAKSPSSLMKGSQKIRFQTTLHLHLLAENGNWKVVKKIELNLLSQGWLID